MSIKTLAGISAAAILSILAGNAYAAATADENEITPSQWYKFNGSMDQFGSSSVSWGDIGNNYIDALDGKAISILASGSASPYTNDINLPQGSWTIVTMAAGKATATPSIIFSNGQGANSGFALATGSGEENNVVVRAWGDETISGYTVGEGVYTDILSATVADVTSYHLYVVAYDSVNKTLSLSVDNGTPVTISGITYTQRGQAQIGGMHAGGHATVGLSRTAGVLLDDFRVYGQLLTTDNLSAIKATFANGFTPDFSYRGQAGQSPTGWYSNWQWNGFNGTKMMVGPDGSSIYMTAATGNNNHPGTELAAKDKRTFAVYANLELMTVGDNTTHTILGVGGSITNCKSVNLVRIGNQVKLGYINNYRHVAYSEGIDVTNLKGWHLFVFSYDSEVGTSLSMDGGTPVTDTSDNAKFVPTAGMQIGVTWQGAVYSGADNVGIAQVLGYDSVLTEKQIAKLAQNYPAMTTLSSDFNYNVADGSIIVPSVTVPEGKFFGAAQGTVVIPAGATVDAAFVKMANSDNQAVNVGLDIAGTLNVTTSHTGDVNSNTGKGALLGHYQGHATYNVTGTFSSPNAYTRLMGDIQEMTINIDGGTFETLAILNNAQGRVWNGSQRGVPTINLTNNGTLKLGNGDLSTADWNAPITRNFGYGTYKNSSSTAWTDSRAITFTDAENGTTIDATTGGMTLAGELSGTAKVITKGSVMLSGVVADTLTFVVSTGTLKVSSSFAGTVEATAYADLSDGTRIYAASAHDCTVAETDWAGKLVFTGADVTGANDLGANTSIYGNATEIEIAAGSVVHGYFPNKKEGKTLPLTINGTFDFVNGYTSNGAFCTIPTLKGSGSITDSWTSDPTVYVEEHGEWTGTAPACIHLSIAKAGTTYYYTVADVIAAIGAGTTIDSHSITTTMLEGTGYTLDAEGNIVIAKTATELFLEGIAAGGEVSLTGDVTLDAAAVIPADKTVTLDLNGCTITAPKTAISVLGALTVKDTGTDGKIVSTGNCGIAVGDGATLTVDSGIIESVEGAIITGKAVGATITINGGTFSASDNAVIAGNGTKREGEANTITINGGTFNGAIKSAGYIACGIYAPWKDQITVDGGTFNITGGCGVCARAGTVAIGSGVTINLINEGTVSGWVGDNKNAVPGVQAFYDYAAKYPGLAEGAAIKSATKLTIAETQEWVGESAPYTLVDKPTGPTSWEETTPSEVIELPEGATTTVTATEIAAWAEDNEVEFVVGITIPVNALILNCAPDAVILNDVKTAADEILEDYLEEATKEVDLATLLKEIPEGGKEISIEGYPMATIKLVPATLGEGVTTSANLFQLSIELK